MRGTARNSTPQLTIQEIDAEMGPEEHDIELRHDPADDPMKRPRESPNIGTGEETRCEKLTLGLGSSTYADDNVVSMTPLP